MLKTFEAVARLHEFSDEHQTSIDDLPDSELEGELHDACEAFIAQDPEFAVAALNQRGWILIPPESNVSGDTVTGPKSIASWTEVLPGIYSYVSAVFVGKFVPSDSKSTFPAFSRIQRACPSMLGNRTY